MTVVQLTTLDPEYRGAAILDELSNRLLPVTFESAQQAQAFLDAAERSGANLYAGMPAPDLQMLKDIWHDAYKRDGQLTPA